jgi:hypothetical protein
VAKDTFYFSHDYGARNDPKMQNLLMAMGHEGKGLYWDIIEFMYEQGGYLKLDDIDTIAFSLRTKPELIHELINNFGLFEKDKKHFYSKSVLKRLDKRVEKSERAKESASKRWQKKEVEKSIKNANALRTHCEGNAKKEMKGNERKGKEKKENERKDTQGKQNENKNGKTPAGVTPPAPTRSALPDQNGKNTPPSDTAKQPMAWNEQSKYAQRLGISAGLSEQIIAIAKENKIMLYRQHWEYFAANANMSVLLPILQSMADASKKRNKSGFQPIGSG